MATKAVEVVVPRELVARLMRRKVVPFLGAGCSVPEPSRLPTADQLARALIQCGVGIEGQPLEDIAEEVWTQGDGLSFAQLLPIDEWRARPPNVITRVVAEFCKERLIAQILTTNWDVLIESALAQIGQPYAKVVDAQSLAIEPTGTVTLIKLNGCIDHPELIKATRAQIEAEEWLEAWVDAVFDVLVRTNSLLFAGYSGASRAATTTVAALVAAAERQATDFLVDRQTPEAIAASSESGQRFVAAINVTAAFTGEATRFFEQLRASVYPLLLERPAKCACDMAEKVVAPSAFTSEQVVAEVRDVANVLKATDPGACQRWLSRCFRSFPDFEHVKPYLPLIPNATDIGRCLLLLAIVRWAGRLDALAELEFAVAVTTAGIPTEVPCHIVVGPPQERLDTAAYAAVVALERESASTAAIGIAFGGLGGVEAVTPSFSAARGAPTRSAARKGGLSIGWIDGDALFATFAPDADAAVVQDRIRHQLDDALTRAVEAAT